MNAAVLKEIEQLRKLTVGGLRKKYQNVFGEASRSHHKDFLFRRIAWRLQAQAEGDLSERARRRALEIAADADLRIRAPSTSAHRISPLPGAPWSAPSMAGVIAGCPRRERC